MFATLLGVCSTSLLTNHSRPLTSAFNTFRAFAHRYGNLRWVDRKRKGSECMSASLRKRTCANHRDMSASCRYCCKSLFALGIKNSPGCGRDFHVKMWGTSSPDDKLTGDLGNVIEATQICGRRSDRLMARKLSSSNFGLLQQYLPAADLFDHLVGECEQLVGNIEAEFLKLARMDDVRRSRVLDHAAARNSARRRVPDRGAG